MLLGCDVRYSGICTVLERCKIIGNLGRDLVRCDVVGARPGLDDVDVIWRCTIYCCYSVDWSVNDELAPSIAIVSPGICSSEVHTYNKLVGTGHTIRYRVESTFGLCDGGNCAIATIPTLHR